MTLPHEKEGGSDTAAETTQKDTIPGNRVARLLGFVSSCPPNGDSKELVTGSGENTEGHDEDSPSEPVDGAELLDELEGWLGRFISVVFDGDLALLALWTVHTHLAAELYTTPRLRIDSTVPASGKTTVLDHLSRLCHRPVQAATLSSPALLPRLLANEVRTVLLDEVDRSLRPDRPGVEDLLAVINSGYRVGGGRPVLVPADGGGWEAKELPTFAPVAMAGNAPNLPDDTRSREIRILLMPDLSGVIEDSDWEFIQDEAKALHDKIAAFARQVKDQISGMGVDLPPNCIARQKEKWRPLKRVAVAAGGRWPRVTDSLIARGLAEDEAEREAGLRTLPPGMVLLRDLYAIWPDHDGLVSTNDLVTTLIAHNPDYWGVQSAYKKALTGHRFGKLAFQAAKATSQRPGGRGPRGFFRSQFEAAWGRLGINQAALCASGANGGTGASGTEDAEDVDSHRLHRLNCSHRLEREGEVEPVQRAGDTPQFEPEALTAKHSPPAPTDHPSGLPPRVQQALENARRKVVTSESAGIDEEATSPLQCRGCPRKVDKLTTDGDCIRCFAKDHCICGTPDARAPGCPKCGPLFVAAVQGLYRTLESRN
ncbi:DUF3631 domain-containing protein [Mycobacterium paraense]|uniref:DUF3631 domain-containing protein n=1 Tax=Mycobacterium paraense TaxID=767916 RepID=UPI000A161DE8|nr:DUF3631 domain-containing protein [Mycobacterium paraense]MCV7441232.1 DUF3631 domain-containing protein [Mycobacterium paraense]ORW48953.1 hypothetical protein AWB89_05295 [Mycobacterium paraense]